MKTYQELYDLTETHIRSMKFDKEPKELYEPISYMLSLGGKRIRPVLLLMAADLFEMDVRKAIPAAVAVEIFHNFTLVHDDIMDNSSIRRGKPTVHKMWDQTVAILSGDLMMIKAVDLLCESETSKLKEIIFTFNKAAAGVCEGQQIDMNYEKKAHVSMDEYLEMITLKTAVLLGCSLELGAILAGAVKDDIDHLYQFGKNIGIAFQIQDDILDSFGDGHKVGKKIGGDIASNKKTLLLIRALELASQPTKEVLQKLISERPADTTRKISAVLKIYDDLNVRQDAEKLKEQFLMKAFDHLEKVTVADARKEPLKSTAIGLMQRLS